LTQVGIDDLKFQPGELKGLAGGVKKSPPMSENQLAIKKLCKQVKQLKDSLEEKDLYCDSLEFFKVVRIPAKQVHLHVSLVRWLTESEIYKGKIESCYTISAETRTGIQGGAIENTIFLYCALISHFQERINLN
jgi:hypothetical protein